MITITTLQQTNLLSLFIFHLIPLSLNITFTLIKKSTLMIQTIIHISMLQQGFGLRRANFAN
jgi:hypothetical protein